MTRVAAAIQRAVGPLANDLPKGEMVIIGIGSHGLVEGTTLVLDGAGVHLRDIDDVRFDEVCTIRTPRDELPAVADARTP